MEFITNEDRTISAVLIKNIWTAYKPVKSAETIGTAYASKTTIYRKTVASEFASSILNCIEKGD